MHVTFDLENAPYLVIIGGIKIQIELVCNKHAFIVYVYASNVNFKRKSVNVL
jgi:hypothetical protein